MDNGNYCNCSNVRNSTEFDPDNVTVKSYTARAKVFFTAISIPEDKQAAIFLS